MKKIKSTADIVAVLENIDEIISILLEDTYIDQKQADRAFRASDTIGTILLEGSEINKDLLKIYDPIYKDYPIEYRGE